jgi:hypothetical protein
MDRHVSIQSKACASVYAPSWCARAFGAEYRYKNHVRSEIDCAESHVFISSLFCDVGFVGHFAGRGHAMAAADWSELAKDEVLSLTTSTRMR